MVDFSEFRPPAGAIRVALCATTALAAAATPGAGVGSVPTLVEGSRAAGLVRETVEVPACGKRRKLYSVAPIAVSDLSHIVPLGNLNPSAHTFPTAHFYMHIRRTVPGDYNSPSAEVPVVAPGRIWVTSLSSSENLDQGTSDFSMHFAPCAEHSAYFIHLTTLSSKLGARLVEPMSCNEYATGGERWRHCTKQVSVELAAGEAIGTAGGGLDRNALDLGASDARISPSVYANPERWSSEQLTRVCALDYFTSSTRRRLRALLGDGQTRRKKKPRCGEVAQDIPGTLQGTWFAAGTRQITSEDPHLALVHDNVDPLKGVFSVGTSTRDSGPASAIYYFDPASAGAVNRDFAQVSTLDKVYCYEVKRRFASATDPATVILAVLTGPSTLRIQGSELTACGSPPWRLGTDYSEFER